MDTITKAILFGGKAIVSIVDATDITNQAIKYHDLSDSAAHVMGRLLAIDAFLSAGMKGANIKLSITVDGDGSMGKMIFAGETGGKVRGYVEHPQVNIPIKSDGKYDVESAIDVNGSLNVIKDFGLREPYVGNCVLAKGDIDSDFAYYFTVSEQLPTVVCSDALIKDGICNACGAILVQPMPNCSEEILFILEDIVRNFKDFAQMLLQDTPEKIIDNYFGHFECNVLPQIYPEYVCKCSQERMDAIVLGLGKEEAYSILDDVGQIQLHCDFCNTYYSYDRTEVDRLFGGDSDGSKR